MHRYHWGFLIGPKKEDGDEVPGVRYHVKNRFGEGWLYEEVSLANVQNTISLLARILIAKIEDEKRLVQIIRDTPLVQNDPEWRCRTWVADVLRRIAEDGKAVGTAELDWHAVEAKGRSYVAAKMAAGRYATEARLRVPKPTWDMIQKKELLE